MQQLVGPVIVAGALGLSIGIAIGLERVFFGGMSLVFSAAVRQRRSR